MDHVIPRLATRYLWSRHLSRLLRKLLQGLYDLLLILNLFFLFLRVELSNSLIPYQLTILPLQKPYPRLKLLHLFSSSNLKVLAQLRKMLDRLLVFIPTPKKFFFEPLNPVFLDGELLFVEHDLLDVLLFELTEFVVLLNVNRSLVQVILFFLPIRLLHS